MSTTVYVGEKRVQVFLTEPGSGHYSVAIGGRCYGSVYHSASYPAYWLSATPRGMLMFGPYNSGLPHNRLFLTRESAIIRLLEREGISC
jgi:hypothetical protein